MSNAPTPDNPGFINWLLIIFLGIIWGSAFMAMSLSLEGFGPQTVAGARLALGAIILNALGFLMGQPITNIHKSRGWPFVIAIGAIAFAMPMLLLTWGQQHVPSAFAGVAMTTVPLIVLPLVYIFSPEEGIGPRRVIGMIIGFIGISMLVGPGAFESSDSDLVFWGRIACIGSACGYAIGSILTRRAPKMPPIALASGTLTVAAILVVPLALVNEGLPESFPMSASLAVLYAALFPTAIGALIRVRVITTAGSLFMNITSYMVPVWSVIFGVILLREDLPAQLYTALALILVGIFITQSRAILAALRKG
ncbi:DMT family transporter [Planktotalea frisia]|uniref:DMT family transporter n=1 Tax=Planktotalea frisia TaxID=696762 RepID=UPI0023564989|nr:DMT family transporter [Planktotalea frisia]